MPQGLTRRRALTVMGATITTLGATGLISAPAVAKGNLASNPIRLPELKIDTVHLKYSQTHYELETGKYYFWTISCDGEEEDIAVRAPDFFANCWINQIVSNDMEVHTTMFYSIEFDDAGSQQIQFIPIRLGQFEYWTPGYENRGLKGTILVN